MAMICTHCGYEGKGKKILRGSRSVEIFIWAVLMIPGPFYSLWRRLGVPRKCTNCGRNTMVSLDSDMGYIAQQKVLMELGVEKVKKADEFLPFVENKSPAEPAPSKAPVDPNLW